MTHNDRALILSLITVTALAAATTLLVWLTLTPAY